MNDISADGNTQVNASDALAFSQPLFPPHMSAAFVGPKRIDLPSVFWFDRLDDTKNLALAFSAPLGQSRFNLIATPL